MKEFIDLLLDNGSIVRVEMKEGDFDEVQEAIDDAIRRGDRWTPVYGETVTIDGLHVSSVNTKRILAIV